MRILQTPENSFVFLFCFSGEKPRPDIRASEHLIRHAAMVLSSEMDIPDRIFDALVSAVAASNSSRRS